MVLSDTARLHFANLNLAAENQWLHLPLITQLKKECGEVFPVAEYAQTSIPTCEDPCSPIKCAMADSFQTQAVASGSWSVAKIQSGT